jgi:Permeases of the major facilitator superfamily
MNLNTQSDRKKVLSWALYDWANSAFATAVMAGFFPLFFKQYWSTGQEPTTSTLRLGLANALASAFIMLIAPVIGAIADHGNAKKKFLLFFALLGITMTSALYFIAQGAWMIAAALYVAAVIGFFGANVFYDSLIVHVAQGRRLDTVSALGFGLGYLGGGLLFSLCVIMTLKPHLFGLADMSQAVRISFLLVATWWAVFSIPIFLFVREPVRAKGGGAWSAVRSGLRELYATLHEIRTLKVVALFLIGYWLYIDGVDTVISMAVDYGLSLGLAANSLITALLITQFVGFPAALLFGKLGERMGAKRGILLAIGVYMITTVFGFFMTSEAEFYGLAVTIGLVQGGIQALSRSLYARIIPQTKSGEFFGFYNMLGKFAAVIGPLLMGLAGVLTGNPRYAILSLIVLFGTGAAFLFFVDEDEGKRAARQLESSHTHK